MNKITRFVLVGLASFFFINPAFAGIPVIDAASIARLVLSYSKQVEQYSKQLDQLRTAQQTYEAMKGSRGMGVLANNPLVRQALPADYYTAYAKVQRLGMGGASAGAREIYEAMKKYGCEDRKYAAGSQGSQDLANCQARAIHAATSVESTTIALKSSQNRVTQLQQLSDTIDYANDAKAAQDLQNRILAEQAFLQNEATMMALAREQRQAEIDLQILASRQEALKKMKGSQDPFAAK